MARKDEERKRGLPPIQLRAAESASNWMQAGIGSAGGGSLGGGSLSGAIGLGGKIGVALLLAALGVGAFGVGRVLAPRDMENLAAQRLAFDKPEAWRGGSNSASAPAADQSSMQVVPESLDGKTEAQRAADAAAAKAAEAQAVPAAADAAAAGPVPATAAPPATDVSGEARKSPFSEKFGELSKFGAGRSGLNGGLGMSNGVGMQFSAKTLGSTSAFTAPKVAKALQARAAPARTGASARSRSFAYNQLARTNGLSRQGAAASGESSNALAGQAFGNAAVSGAPVTGIGAGNAAGITGAGAGTQSGPIGGTQNANEGTSAAPAASHKNSSPWQTIVMAGVAALILGGLLLTFAQKKISAGKKLMAANPAAGGPMIAMGKMLGMLGAALGAIAAGIGLALWQHFHQKAYGAIFIVGGGLLVGIGAMILTRSEDKDAADQDEQTVDGMTHKPDAQAPGQSHNVGAALPKK